VLQIGVVPARETLAVGRTMWSLRARPLLLAAQCGACARDPCCWLFAAQSTLCGHTRIHTTTNALAKLVLPPLVLLLHPFTHTWARVYALTHACAITLVYMHNTSTHTYVCGQVTVVVSLLVSSLPPTLNEMRIIYFVKIRLNY